MRKKSVVILFIVLILSLFPTATAFGDTFPEGTFNGMIFTYTITGVTVEKTLDEPGFTTGRSLTGKVSGGTVHVSGSAVNPGRSSDLYVSITAGGKTVEKKINSKTINENMDFDLSIAVPARSDCSIVIGQSTFYGNGETRGLEIDGSFERMDMSTEPPAADTPASNSGTSFTDTTSSQTDQSETPWAVVIGGGAAVGAAATAMIKKALSQKNKKGNEDGPAGYILQLSSERLQVGEESPASLQVTAYRVNKTGGYAPAPEVKLQISATPDSCLKITPDHGQSQMSVVISMEGKSGGTSETLTITGTAPESMVTATAAVELTAKYKIVFF
jgi:hypothetical protein